MTKTRFEHQDLDDSHRGRYKQHAGGLGGDVDTFISTQYADPSTASFRNEVVAAMAGEVSKIKSNILGGGSIPPSGRSTNHHLLVVTALLDAALEYASRHRTEIDSILGVARKS
jgi:hypothetical protein